METREIPINNIQGFLRSKKKIEEMAASKQFYVRYSSRNRDSMELLYSTFSLTKSRSKAEERQRIDQAIQEFIELANRLIEARPEELAKRQRDKGRQI